MIDAEQISQKQERALAELLRQPTIAMAANAAEVGENTIYRWLREDVKFKDAYMSARK